MADNVTVENSRIHDNACKGLWADVNSHSATIINNHVYNNWDEGIFIEISSGATITGNNVSPATAGTRMATAASGCGAAASPSSSSDHIE